MIHNSTTRRSVVVFATCFFVVFGCSTFLGAGLRAQEASNVEEVSSSAMAPSLLPDAPSAMLRGSYVGEGKARRVPAAVGPVAPVHEKYIPAGWTAQPIAGRDKVLLGLKDTYAFHSFAAKFVSAGYEHLTNGAPNYGTDRGAFGERLGAAGIRQTTQGIFTDSLFAPLLHEDPRYYVEGSQFGLVHRALYAATRPLITRTDSGKNTVNGALLLGYAGAAALNDTYYPSINRNARDMASVYAGSIGGAALGFVVAEFSDQLLVAVHLKKAQ